MSIEIVLKQRLENCRHEGRNWYSAHRGRLWIAAAAKEPDMQEVKAYENAIRLLRGGKLLKLRQFFSISFT